MHGSTPRKPQLSNLDQTADPEALPLGLMTSAELIRRTGQALFGDSWRVSDLADALGVNERTLRRWMSGSEEPRPGVWRDLHAIAVKRTADLAALIPHLEGRGSTD